MEHLRNYITTAKLVKFYTAQCFTYITHIYVCICIIQCVSKDLLVLLYITRNIRRELTITYFRNLISNTCYRILCCIWLNERREATRCRYLLNEHMSLILLNPSPRSYFIFISIYFLDNHNLSISIKLSMDVFF